jgi:hypothetical protein
MPVFALVRAVIVFSSVLRAAGLGVAMVMLASAAQASTPEAWKAYSQQVLRACRAASTLRQPRPAGDRVDLPAANGTQLSVLVLEGTYPQAHMAGRRGLELCVYDLRSRNARMAEADRLIRQP